MEMMSSSGSRASYHEPDYVITFVTARTPQNEAHGKQSIAALITGQQS
jgi:hypothetical protein